MVDLKIAMDDMRAHQASLVALITATDQKALALYRLYATIAPAAGATGIGLLSSSETLARFGSWALIALAAMLVVGCFLCSRALISSRIALPGRDASFWQWTLDEDATDSEILQGYCKELIPMQVETRNLNERTAGWFSLAVSVGFIAPVVALTAGGISACFC
jgi:hypothetical protein